MRGLGIVINLLLIYTHGAFAADQVDRQISVIAAVGPLGEGSAAARQACNELSQRGPEILPRLLSAMDTSNIVAANWYRAAYERILEGEASRPKPSSIPVGAIENYVRTVSHQGRARRLALDFLARLEPSFGKELLPTLLDDPEFRDDAVAIALKQGDEARAHGNTAAAKRAFHTAFEHARNPSQVTRAAELLGSLGEKVSIVEHLGFVCDWYLVGPFAAPGTSGFRKSFPPENAVNLGAPSTANEVRTLRWTRHRTDDPLGTVDLVQALGPADEAVAYAYTEIESGADRDAQLRCSADDNLSVWLNGQKVFDKEMWLNGTRLDRFITPVHLKTGRNHLLVKICQSAHHRDPSVGNAWTFQLRFCSAEGAGLGLKTVPPTKMSTSPRAQEAAR
jgi:hypothetical protein